MSTLPFLLSVADELDNLNSQNYMDDFGLGFHPHRQYYRTPTIQLSLPASTEWMEQEQGRHHSRYRSTYRYYGEPQNNLQSPAEGDEEDNEDRDNPKHDNDSGLASAAAQKYVSALNSNHEKDDIIDNSLQLYNISKKCSKDYYRHAEPSTSSATALSAAASTSTSKPPPLPPRSSTAATASKAKETKPNMSYRLHSKCLEGNNSSSEESLQKVTSSIEFLTCFLLKKTRASKSPSGAEGKKS
ncbi:hypothetical protein FF38_08296 [Lucilia cuprina]|uniref:Uncharacterized protein n=1 Tax=Lucilia cuprina TaxID=7375 RepID=A0A0L0C7V4_LUCCU|nr:hypothetical protein CVS40_12273 [Lucilia cuprina]KNC28341.1 hypothetical protein FF38_08296 [Lucilia cuprina]